MIETSIHEFGTFDRCRVSTALRGHRCETYWFEWSRSALQTLYGDVSDIEFIERKLKGKTRRLFTSGGKEYVPDGEPGRHSPFAARFIKALESRGINDRILTTDEIFSFLERATPQPHRGLFTADGAADFIFVARPNANDDVGEGEFR